MTNKRECVVVCNLMFVSLLQEVVWVYRCPHPITAAILSVGLHIPECKISKDRKWGERCIDRGMNE